MTKLTLEEAKEIAEYYKNTSLADTCLKFNIKQSTLLQQFKKYNLKPKKTITDKKIFIEYYSKHSQEETAKYFNVSTATITRYARKIGYKKPRENIIALRKETISQDTNFWNKRNQNTIKTNRLKYGVDYYAQTDEYKENTKKANLKKYGCEWSLQAAEVREKYKQTCLDKYGCENAGGAKETINKIKQTKLERYGSQNYNNRPKCQKTWIENDYIGEHKFRRYIYNNIYFDSLPEIAYYMYMLVTGNKIERCYKKFEYYYLDKRHYYIPDFIVNDKIIEIKSDYLLGYLKTPNTIYNAKYKCMLDNNVEIITQNEYKKYVKWFNKNYDKEKFRNRR